MYWILILSLGSYLLLIAFIGHLAGRRVKTMENYLVAGRNLPFCLALPTIVAAWFGAGSCLGMSGTAYSEGFYGVIPDPFACSFGLILAGLVFAAPIRRLKLLTISDLLGKAYGIHFERIATITTIPFYVGTLASQMVAMGYVFQVVFGGEAEWGMLIGTCIVAIYTISGGMWTVTITDLIQLFLLLVGLMILLPICFAKVADLTVLFPSFWSEFSHIRPQSGATSDWLSFIGRVFMTGFGALMGQDLIQRCLATRSVGIARSSAIVGGCVYFFLGLIPLFIGIAGRAIYPILEKPEQLMLLMAKDYLSPLSFALFGCALLSAIMSTADSYLLAGSSLITHNLILKIYQVQSEPAKVRLVRIVNFGMMLLALGLALNGPSIFNLMVHSGVMLFVAILIPASAALFWKKANSQAAWGSMILGVGGWGASLLLGIGAKREETLFAAAAIGGMLSLTTYLLITWTRPLWLSETIQPIPLK